jgi:hypothetical protein
VHARQGRQSAFTPKIFVSLESTLEHLLQDKL